MRSIYLWSFMLMHCTVLKFCSGQKRDGRTDGQTNGRTSRLLYAILRGHKNSRWNLVSNPSCRGHNKTIKTTQYFGPSTQNCVLVCLIYSWPQIKMTLYDFSDLQLTGEFKNRPGTGLFLTFFLALSHIVRVPADFTRIKQIFAFNDVYINININHTSSKETDG